MNKLRDFRTWRDGKMTYFNLSNVRPEYLCGDVMQYIWWCDDLGNPIFEKDIVKVEGFVGQVVHDYMNARFVVVIGNDISVPICTDLHIKLIGNVYEPPKEGE